MTQAPTPGPLDSESVKLLVKGDLLRVKLAPHLIGADQKIEFGTVVSVEGVSHGVIGVRGDHWGPGAFAFIGRPDADGWMPWSGGENPVPGKWCEWFFEHTGPYAGLSSDTLWDRVTRFRLAPTAPVEASGSEREHGPKCWGKTSFSDEMMYCYCGSTDSPPGEMREAVLKGVGKVNGDGWKDTTTKGETVFVWNAEKPAPYAPGQYPRVGNEGWSASTLQYDFTPAAADDVPAILAALSTTPARAEAQDEGAAGEPVGDGMPIGEGFLYRTTMTGERHIVHEATGFTIAKLPYDYRYTDNATQKSLADKIVALYAHPSPPPAADEDRVLDEAAKYLKAQYGASYGRDHPRDRARIKNALKSEGQS